MKDISTNVFFDKFERISTVLSLSICLFTLTLPYQFSFPFSFSLLRQKDKKVIKLNFHWIYSSAPHFFFPFFEKNVFVKDKITGKKIGDQNLTTVQNKANKIIRNRNIEYLELSIIDSISQLIFSIISSIDYLLIDWEFIHKRLEYLNPRLFDL